MYNIVYRGDTVKFLKRLAVLVLSLVLLLSVLTVPSSAAGTPYFFAVNDNIYQLSDYNMPVSYGGFVYVPYTNFSTYATGVFALYEPSLSLLYLYSGSSIIYFDLANNTTYDNNEVSYPLGAVAMNGTIYVPCYLTCDFLGLSMTVTYTTVAPLLRITTGSQSLSDSEMVDSNLSFMKKQYNSYMGISDEPVLPPEPDNPGNVNNSQEKPDDVGEQENKEGSDYGSVSVYLSVHTAPENVNDVLEALGGRSAVFYFTGDEIAADPGAVRSVLCAGRRVGIWLEQGDYDEYVQANALLFEAAMTTTFFVSGEGQSMAEEHGLIYWGSSVVYEQGSYASTVTGALTTASGGRDCVLFNCQEDCSGAVRDVVGYLRQYNYSVQEIRETTRPVV